MPSPVAVARARRLARDARTALPTSLLPVGHDVALADVGLVPVGEAMGAVSLFEPESFASAGMMSDAQNRTYTSNGGSRWNGPGNEAATLTSGIRTTQERLLEEAVALGADGVVGVRLDFEVEPVTRVWRFQASGTAVRSTGRTRATTPFTTDLDGAQVAGAMRSGWVPVAFLMVPVHAIRAVDSASYQQARRQASNGEVGAATDIVNVCRHEAREAFAAAARRTGADGAVLTSIDLDFETPAVGSPARARVLVRGTAISRFRVPDRSSALTVLPLTPNPPKAGR